MKIEIEYTEEDVKRLVLEDISKRFQAEKNITEKDVLFEVMTKENYRATAWENGRFRATIMK